MINIVVVTHGDFGEALVRAAEMIVGPQEGVHVVSLRPGENPEGFGDKLDVVLERLRGQDTLILLDLLGGTPYNVSARMVLKPNVECVTGVNMAMLIEALTSRDSTALPELAAAVTAAGQKSVVNLRTLLCKTKGGEKNNGAWSGEN